MEPGHLLGSAKGGGLPDRRPSISFYLQSFLLREGVKGGKKRGGKREKKMGGPCSLLVRYLRKRRGKEGKKKRKEERKTVSRVFFFQLHLRGPHVWGKQREEEKEGREKRKGCPSILRKMKGGEKKKEREGPASWGIN